MTTSIEQNAISSEREPPPSESCALHDAKRAATVSPQNLEKYFLLPRLRLCCLYSCKVHDPGLRPTLRPAPGILARNEIRIDGDRLEMMSCNDCRNRKIHSCVLPVSEVLIATRSGSGAAGGIKQRTSCRA
eukprot:6176316-Pleurochrysis_carterae.AAC.10